MFDELSQILIPIICYLHDISLLPSNLFCELDKNMDKIKQFFFWERMNMISLGILLNQFDTLLVVTYYCHRQAPWSLS